MTEFPDLPTQVDDRTALEALILLRDLASAQTASTQDAYGETAEHMRGRARAFLAEHGLT